MLFHTEGEINENEWRPKVLADGYERTGACWDLWDLSKFLRVMSLASEGGWLRFRALYVRVAILKLIWGEIRSQ